jgi:copper chaperone CopZ
LTAISLSKSKANFLLLHSIIYKKLNFSKKMNKSIKILMAISVLLSFTLCNAQIKNAKTESVRIFGNCGMCKTTIETAGNQKKIAKVDWDKDTKIATIIYDAKKTNPDEILKRIALSGYDSEKFLAPNEVYAKLPKCCQYERKAQTTAKVETPKMEVKDDFLVMTETRQDVSQLKAVFDNYFAVKDALVKTDGSLASVKAKELLNAINVVKMDKLTTEEHTVWMKIIKDLKFDAEHIEETKNAGHQRDHFNTLSDNMYQLLKVSKQETPTYYQHCPMANNSKGANWLSKENEVKNPYYGNQMLSCGKVVEKIK